MLKFCASYKWWKKQKSKDDKEMSSSLFKPPRNIKNINPENDCQNVTVAYIFLYKWWRAWQQPKIDLKVRFDADTHTHTHEHAQKKQALIHTHTHNTHPAASIWRCRHECKICLACSSRVFSCIWLMAAFRNPFTQLWLCQRLSLHLTRGNTHTHTHTHTHIQYTLYSEHTDSVRHTWLHPYIQLQTHTHAGIYF